MYRLNKVYLMSETTGQTIPREKKITITTTENNGDRWMQEIPDRIFPKTFLKSRELWVPIQSIIIEGVGAEIEESTFKNYIPLKSITLNGVETIGKNAFDGCSSLESVILSEGLTTIEDEAFNKCSALKSIIIPKGVTTIGSYAFAGCTSLESIIFLDAEEEEDEDDFHFFEIEVEEKLTIGVCAFTNCSSLESIRLPKGVTRIKERTFYECEKLVSVTLPRGVTVIGRNAFTNCILLSDIPFISGFHSALKFIGYEAFMNCKSLTSVTITKSLEDLNTLNVITIEPRAFFCCNELGKVIIGEGVTEISAGTFAECHLLRSVILPKGVRKIGSFAFESCRKLSSINIPEGVTTIGVRAFYCCHFLYYVAIPKSVTVISREAFRMCGLTSIIIPDRVKVISERCFSGCVFLVTVVIPRSCEVIYKNAFLKCANLSLVVGPNDLDIRSSQNPMNPRGIRLPPGNMNVVFKGCPRLPRPDYITPHSPAAVIAANMLNFWSPSTRQLCSRRHRKWIRSVVLILWTRLMFPGLVVEKLLQYLQRHELGR